MTGLRPSTAITTGTVLSFDISVNPHVHLRLPEEDGDGKMEMAVAECAPHHDIVYAIVNVKGYNTAAMLRRYKAKGQRCVPPGQTLDIRTVQLITDESTLADAQDAWERRDGVRASDARKIFLRGVSNDNGMCLVDWRKARPILRHAVENRVPIFVHLEQAWDASGKFVSILEREWTALQEFMIPVHQEFPDLETHILHVGDVRVIEYIVNRWQKGHPTYGGLCPQYRLRTFTDLFREAHFHSHELCWPIYGEERDCEAVDIATVSALGCFRDETDYAMHSDDVTQPTGVKVNCRGDVCGGLAIFPSVARSLTIERFVEAGKVGAVNHFSSYNARSQLQLPAASRQVRYRREDWTVPDEVTWKRKDGKEIRVIPFLAGSTRQWQLVA